MYCFKKHSLLGLYPAINVGKCTRFDWNTYGCTDMAALFETIIKENYKLGRDKFIVIEKYVQICGEGGAPKLTLGPEYTLPDPNLKHLKGYDLGDAHYRIELRHPPWISDPRKDMPLFVEDGLKTYQQYKKSKGNEYHPHKYPAPAVRHLNPFLLPHVVPAPQFSRLVGMRCRHFWDLVDKLVDAGLQRHRNLSVEAMVTLYRMKLRENSDFSHLSVMFGCMDDGELTRVFYEVALLHFESSCTVPRLWTTPNLSYDEINAFFDEFIPLEEPLYQNLINLVKDPRDGPKPRIPVPLCGDSTKVSIQKSRDAFHQRATFFISKKDTFVTFTNITLPDGTDLLHACASASVR